MISKKTLKNFIDYKYFELPPSPWKCFKTAFKFGLAGDKLTFDTCILVAGKTTRFDKLLLGRLLNSNYLTLKDSVVKQICDGTLPKDEEKEILEDIKLFQEAFISVLIFPERDFSVFGDTAPIRPEMAKFLKKTGQNIRLINLINTYFSYPIWAENFRKCEVSYSRKFELKSSKYSGLGEGEFLEKLNGFMPSSATTYARKFLPNMLSDKRALGLDKVVYCCTNCGKLFEVYSEFSQLKCRNCGSAIELDNNGTIHFSKTVKDLDELKTYQFDLLKSMNFGTKLIIKYKNVFKCFVLDDNSTSIMDIADLEIYRHKVVLVKNKFEETYLFKDIRHVELGFDNTLILYLKNMKKIAICGKNSENLYIICDLFKIFNEK